MECGRQTGLNSGLRAHQSSWVEPVFSQGMIALADRSSRANGSLLDSRGPQGRCLGWWVVAEPEHPSGILTTPGWPGAAQLCVTYPLTRREKSSVSFLLAKSVFLEQNCSLSVPSVAVIHHVSPTPHAAAAMQRLQPRGIDRSSSSYYKPREREGSYKSIRGMAARLKPSGISHLYGKRHIPAVFEWCSQIYGGQQEQFFPSPIPYDWWQ